MSKDYKSGKFENRCECQIKVCQNAVLTPLSYSIKRRQIGQQIINQGAAWVGLKWLSYGFERISTRASEVFVAFLVWKI